MFNLKGAFSSCLTVVAFLILIVLAARFYGGTNNQTKVENSTVYQQRQDVFKTVWSYATAIAGISMIKNVGVGNANLEQNVKTVVSNYVNSNFKNDSANPSNSEAAANSATGLNSYEIENNRPLVDLTKGNNIQATASSSDLKLTDVKNLDLNSKNLKEEISSLSSFVNYQKTASGAELIIKSKSGAEYKLPLPFSFLAQ